MSFLPEELKRQTFPCPKCGEIISSDVDNCRFCNFSLNTDVKESAIKNELETQRKVRIRDHKIWMVLGVGIFLIGLGGIVSPVIDSYTNSRTVNFSCITPICLVGGIIVFVKGISGYIAEKRKAIQ